MARRKIPSEYINRDGQHIEGIDVSHEKGKLYDASELKHTKPKKNPKNPRKKKGSHKSDRKMDFDINKAIEMTAYKIPAVGIAQYFGFHQQTLVERLKEYGYKSFNDFKQYHSEKKVNSVREKLFDKAINEGHFNSIKLIAEAYTEIGDKNNGSGTGGLGFDVRAPQIIFLDDDLNVNHIKLELDEKAIALKKKNFLKHQWQFIQDNVTKYLALVAGIGSGKTHIFLRKTLIAHLSMICDNGDNIGKSDGIIVYPTLTLGMQLFWNPFLALLHKIGLKYKTNKAEHTIETSFGVIRLLTGETPEKIVGFNASYVGIDELDTMKKAQEVWDNCNARLRGKEDGQIFITTTPEGYRFMYKKFVKEPQKKVENGEEVQTKMIRAKTMDNPFIPEDWLKSLRGQYTDKQLQAYLNGDFVNFKGSQAYSFDRNLNVLPKLERKEKERIYCGMDFNVNPMSFILFNANVTYENIGNDKKMPVLDYLNVFESVSLKNSNTRKACEWINKNYPDEDITFIVDRSGNARKTSADKTDVEIIREFGYKVNYLNNLSERDKLNYCNLELERGTIRIDERKGSYLIDDLEAVTLNEFGEINKKDKTLTHQSDSLAYSVAWLVRKKAETRSIDGYLGLM